MRFVTKVVWVVGLVAAFAMPVPGSAQVAFGVSGGLSLASLTGDDVDEDLDGRTGFNVGAFAELPLADIIWLVNYVFKGGAWPQPRVESGDVNGDCSISASDIIVTVNYVFKSGQPLVEGCAGY